MPLKKGKSKSTILYNIKELQKANKNKKDSKKKRSNEQIIAIAMNQAKNSKRKK